MNASVINLAHFGLTILAGIIITHWNALQRVHSPLAGGKNIKLIPGVQNDKYNRPSFPQ